MDRTQLMKTYVLFVAALGALALAQSLRTLSLAHVDPLILVILVALAAAAQRMPVFLFRSSAISISFAAVIASYVLYGTEVAVVVSLFQAGVNAFTPRRKPALKALFNAGSLATSAFVGGSVYRLVGGQVPPGEIALTLVAVAVSAAAYFLVNTATTALVISISERQSFVAGWPPQHRLMPGNLPAPPAPGPPPAA